MGNSDLQEMGYRRMDPDLTKAGRICGMVATGLMTLWAVLVVLMIVPMALLRP